MRMAEGGIYLERLSRNTNCLVAGVLVEIWKGYLLNTRLERYF
jgi:hypothetical protein